MKIMIHDFSLYQNYISYYVWVLVAGDSDLVQLQSNQLPLSLKQRNIHLDSTLVLLLLNPISATQFHTEK